MPSQLSRCLFISIALLSFNAYLALAQKVNTDSLEQVVASAAQDSTKIDALLQLAAYQIKHQMKDSLGLINLEKAKEQSTVSHYPEGLFQVWITTGNYYRSKALWSESMDAYHHAIAAAEEIRDEPLKNRGRMMAYNNLGGILNFNGDFQSAIENRLKALEITEMYFPENENNKGIILLNIASDYRQLSLPAKSLDYLERTAAFFDSLSERLQMEFFIEYYEAYALQSDTNRADAMLKRLQAGLEKFDLSDFQKMDYQIVYHELAGTFERDFRANYPRALSHFRDALQLATELGEPNKQAEYQWNIGETQRRAGDLKSAIHTLEMARDSSAAYALNNLSMKITTDLAAAYADHGDFKEATRTLQENIRLRTQIYDEDRTRETGFLEARYESVRKEKEIADLQLSDAEHKIQLTRRNRTLWIGGLSALVLLLLAGLGIRSGRQKRVIAEREKDLQSERANMLERQQQVVSLQAMINGQESERSRVAKELHDSMGGMFGTLKMYLAALEEKLPEVKGVAVFPKINEVAGGAAGEIRRIAHDMMPEVLLKLGLTKAISQLIENLNSAGTIHVTFQHFGLSERYSPAFERMLYRIIQELLNNILKHARATEVLVQFVEEDYALHITVEDNGRGFDPQAQFGNAAGLDSVRHRVQYLNGSISIDSEDAVGTTVVMEFLLDR